MEAKFKKISNGEWRVAVTEKVDVDGGNNTITVSMRDGSQKQVKITRIFSREGGEYLYIPVADKRPVSRNPTPYKQDRYVSAHVSGECDDCVANMDMGDGRGCARHRGNPHT
jgi:hypothetical protein